LDRDQTRRSAAEQLTASLLVLLDAAAEQIARRVVEELRQREATRDRLERDKRQKSRSPWTSIRKRRWLGSTAHCQKVVQLIGMSRASLWRMEREGRFPVRRRVGIRRVGWLEGEVREWDCQTVGSSRPVVIRFSSWRLCAGRASCSRPPRRKDARLIFREVAAEGTMLP
jgi:predicted DNA-binding transcriptional regulator AlpA